MTDRPTASTITDTQLDALHERLERAEAFVTGVADIIADHEGDDWAAHPATTAIRRGFAGMPYAVGDTEVRRQLADVVKALGTSETELAGLRAALARVRELHRKATHGDVCVYCAPGQRLGYDTTWPCDTIRALDGPGRADTTPDELTADQARDLVDELGTDLYRAQDALAFVGECCDIADRERRQPTTGDVREWLKGARCARQLAAEAQAAPVAPEPVPAVLREQLAAAILADAADCAYRIARRLDDQHHDQRAQGAWDVENVLRAEVRRLAAEAQPASDVTWPA